MLRRDTLGLGEVFRAVDVEKRVDGLICPLRQGDAVTPRPDFDLVKTFVHQRPPQLGAQRDGPEARHGMAPIARLGAGEGLCLPRPGHQWSALEWRIGYQS